MDPKSVIYEAVKKLGYKCPADAILLREVSYMRYEIRIKTGELIGIYDLIKNTFID